MKEEKVEMEEKDEKDEKADIADNASDDLVPSLEGTDTSVMTAEMPDTAFSSPPISYHLKFDCDFGGGSEGPLDDDTLTDDDTPPSDASAETCWMRGWRGQEGTLEEHKIGPGPKLNSGPPYAVGDVIVCDSPGASRGLQRAFVLGADHPIY